MVKYCPFCGEGHVDDAKFCKNCGKNIENYKGTGEPAGQGGFPVAENNHTIAFAVGLLFSLLIPLIGIIIGIYIYTRKDSSKAKTYGLVVIVLGVLVWIVSLLLSLSWGLF